MLPIIAELSIYIILLLIFIQDIRKREVSLLLLLLLPLLLSINSYINGIKILNVNVIFNFVFLIFQLSAVSLYYLIKNKKLEFIVNKYIGVGDIIIFFTFALFFPTVNYILFFILSLILSIIYFITAKSILKKEIQTIPLAGLQSIFFLIIFLVTNFKIIKIDLFDTNMSNFIASIL